MQFQYQFFRETGRLLRETTHWFAPQLQPVEDVERTGAAVRAERVDALLGHRSDGVVAGLGRLPTGPAGVADGKDQDALLCQGLFDGGRVAAVEGAPQSPDHRVAGFQQEFKDGFFERRLETADYDTVGSTTRFGPAEGLLLDGRRDDARGEEGDLPTVEQGGVARVIVIESHKKRGSRIHLSHTQAFAAPTKNKDTDNPREHICTDCTVRGNQMYMQHMDVLLHPLLCSSKLRSLSMKEDRN